MVSPNRQYESMLTVARERLSRHAPESIARRAGVTWDGGRLTLPSLGQTVTVTVPDFAVSPELDMWHALTLLHYLDLADGTPLLGKMMAFAQYPDGMVRGGGFDRRAELVIRRQLGLLPPEELLRRYSVINKRYWEMLERGEMSREKLLVGRFQELFDEIGCEVPAAEVQDRYEEVLSTGHWFMPGAEEMLEALYGKCRLFICSNGNAQVQDGRLASSGIEKYFEGIFISERIGYDKPDARYFDACFARIPDFSKERAIMILYTEEQPRIIIRILLFTRFSCFTTR